MNPTTIDRDPFPPLTFTADEREAFRWRVEALMNGVERIQRLSDESSRFYAPTVIRQNRIELARQAAKLMGDLCGNWIKLSELDASSELGYIAMSLRIWQPVIAMQDEYDFFWDELIDEIERLPFGDEPEILKPASRSPGAHRQPARIAMRRLSALQWAEFLKAQNVRPGQYHREIALAFGADWDAIRKWRNSSIALFGEDYVRTLLSDAREGFGLRFSFPDYRVRLHGYGASYRALAGLGSIDPDAFEAALGTSAK